jgi:hypothetical protein
MTGISSSIRSRIVDREVMKLNLREAARREAEKTQRAVTRAASKARSSGAR